MEINFLVPIVFSVIYINIAHDNISNTKLITIILCPAYFEV